MYTSNFYLKQQFNERIPRSITAILAS